MCHGKRSQQRTAGRTANSKEETEETAEQREPPSRGRDESPSRGIVDGPVRALKRAYALVASP